MAIESAEMLSPDYIVPDNDIWLLKLIPLEQNYENTILWEQGVDITGISIPGETIAQARDRQFTWFTSTSGSLHIQATTYQREGRKYVRVDRPIKDLIGYNYIVFKNNGQETVGGVVTNRYENKYYYGFITKYEYLNDRVTIVHYAIDLMQTFNFDYVVDQCLVEREHSATDIVGENILEEPIKPGEVEYTYLGCPTSLTSWKICALVSEVYALGQNADYIWTHGVGSLVGNLYSPVQLLIFTDAMDATTQIGVYTDQAKSDAIVAIFMAPEAAAISYQVGTTFTDYWGMSKDNSWVYAYNGKIGPRNKKLYTYPYNKLYVTNNIGEAYEYHYEYFKSNNCSFNIVSSVLANGEVMCIPMDYRINRISSSVPEPNYNERIVLKDFPQCAYTIDSYRAWLAQNAGKLRGQMASIAIEGVGSLISGGAALATGNAFMGLGAINGALQTFNNAIQMYEHEYDMSRVPDIVKGQATSSLSMATNTFNFYGYNVKVTPQRASIIDDFFDLYGYSCKRLKVPNRNVRENWCYTKTSGCRLTGSIPGDVDEKICSIYDNGIRFWKNPNNIGRYNTLTNRCVSEITT